MSKSINTDSQETSKKETVKTQPKAQTAHKPKMQKRSHDDVEDEVTIFPARQTADKKRKVDSIALPDRSSRQSKAIVREAVRRSMSGTRERPDLGLDIPSDEVSEEAVPTEQSTWTEGVSTFVATVPSEVPSGLSRSEKKYAQSRVQQIQPLATAPSEDKENSAVMAAEGDAESKSVTRKIKRRRRKRNPGSGMDAPTAVATGSAVKAVKLATTDTSALKGAVAAVTERAVVRLGGGFNGTYITTESRRKPKKKSRIGVENSSDTFGTTTSAAEVQTAPLGESGATDVTKDLTVKPTKKLRIRVRRPSRPAASSTAGLGDDANTVTKQSVTSPAKDMVPQKTRVNHLSEEAASARKPSRPAGSTVADLGTDTSVLQKQPVTSPAKAAVHQKTRVNGLSDEAVSARKLAKKARHSAAAASRA